jgi:hypothetical protein
MNLWVPYEIGRVSLVAAQMAVSQKGLSSFKLVNLALKPFPGYRRRHLPGITDINYVIFKLSYAAVENFCTNAVHFTFLFLYTLLLLEVTKS